MATPARKLEQLRSELFDHRVRKHAMWLYGLGKELERARDEGDLDVPSFHDLMGVVYGHRENYGAAVWHGRAAVALDPSFKIARHNLAVSLTKLGHPEEAIAILEEILRQGLAEVDEYLSLVSAYVSAARWNSARAALACAVCCADLRNLDHLWRLMRASADARKYEQTVEMFGRYLAVRSGHSEDEVVKGPLAYVLRALEGNDRLKDVPDMPSDVEAAIQRLRRRNDKSTRAAVAPESTDDQDAETLAVFNAWAPASRRATKVVISNDG